jgi:hypothetical protein
VPFGPTKSRFQSPPLQKAREMDFRHPNPYVLPYITVKKHVQWYFYGQEISGPIQRWFLISYEFTT